MNGKSDNRTHSALLSLFDFGKLYARTSCEIKHQSGETLTQSSIQYRHTITPPSALVPPCADVRGVRPSPPRHALTPRCFSNSCTVLVGNPDVPLRAGSPGAGQPGTSQSYLGTGPLPHSVTVPPGGHIALRSAYPDRAGQPFTEPPGDLPQTGSPDSPGVSRLGDTSGAL